jgi:ABC-type transport system substrate-binding protein
MSSKLTLAIGGVAAVLMLALAAILLLIVSGGDGDEGDGGNEPSATKTEDKGDDPGPAGAGELRIRGDDPLVLDPAVAQDAGSAFYIVEIFAGLVRLDADLQPAPDIAESWDMSDDGTVFTFRLNPKATFHDGRPVTAEDVKLSWERALNPDTASIVADAGYPVIGPLGW